jgi:formate hydrogenlyase subunit 6/NADH:ubiquinone oxidoreductase subunit I
MRFTMVPRLLLQLFKKPFTNTYPVKYAPSSTTRFFEGIQTGKTTVVPPVVTPENYRGKIVYDREKCIGCEMCLEVCPSEAIVFKAQEKKIKIFLARCTFCSQCNDVCPVQCLSMSHEFLLAETNKYAKELIVE